MITWLSLNFQRPPSITLCPLENGFGNSKEYPDKNLEQLFGEARSFQETVPWVKEHEPKSELVLIIPFFIHCKLYS